MSVPSSVVSAKTARISLFFVIFATFGTTGLTQPLAAKQETAVDRDEFHLRKSCLPTP
jgi:hypothetical protein